MKTEIKFIILILISIIVIILFLSLSNSGNLPNISEKEFNKGKYQEIKTDYITFELPKTATHYWNATGNDIYEVIISNFSVKNNSNYILKITWSDDRYINENFQIHYNIKSNKLNLNNIDFLPLEDYDKACLMSLVSDKQKTKQSCEKQEKKSKLKFKNSKVQIGVKIREKSYQEINKSCYSSCLAESINYILLPNQILIGENQECKDKCLINVVSPVYNWANFPSSGISINNLPSDFLAIDDIEVSSCGTLNSAGSSYIQTANIIPSGDSNCITISAENISFNGNGFSISNSTYSSTAIYSNQKNTTIKNANISLKKGSQTIFSSAKRCADSIYLVTDSGGTGIDLDGNNSYIFNNTIISQQGVLAISSFNKIENSTTYTEINGFSTSTYNNLSGNFATNSSPYSINIGFIFGNNSILTKNTGIFNLYDFWLLSSFSTLSETNSSTFLYINCDYNTLLNSIYLNKTSLSSAIGNIFKDSQLSNSTLIFLYSSTNNTFLNVTYNQSREIVDSNSQLIRKWYFTAQANYSHNLTEFPEANITAYNVSGNFQFSSLTGSDGKISQQLIEYVNSGTRSFYSNYTINSNKTGWITDTKSINISANTFQKFLMNDSISPEIYISHPISQYYSYNSSILLNYTSIDFGMGISSCWFYILNDVGYEISNTTLPNCQNTTFNVSDEKQLTLYLYANDTLGNENYSSVIFATSTSKPQIILNYPNDNFWLNFKNNVYFNFTATQSKGIDTCKLYSNWTGNWNVNYTWINPNNATMNFTAINLSDGYYKWNVWCNNTVNIDNFALLNRTFGIDTIFPILNLSSPLTSQGSQTISFIYNITEKNPQSCYYSIFNSSGAIDGLNNNISLSCSGTSSSATVTSYATYNLTLYAKDKAGNENYSSKIFTTSPSSLIEGGVAVSPLGLLASILAQNFTFTEQRIDLSLAKDSSKPRTKSIYLTNKYKIPITLDLVCDTTEANQSSKNINICNYVKFRNSTITLSPNEEIRNEVIIEIYYPENASFGDVFYFNIFALKQAGEPTSYYSKLSVSSKVSILATIFYKWRYLSKTRNISYPAFPVNIFISFLFFISLFLLISRIFKLFLTGIFLSLILSLSIFIILSFYW